MSIRRRIAYRIEDAGISLLCAGVFAGLAAAIIVIEIANRIGGRK